MSVCLLHTHTHTHTQAQTIFGVKSLEFQFFGGFQKNEYILGYDDFADSLRSMYKMGIFLGVAKISNIFRVLDIPDVFFFGGGEGVNSKRWVQAYG